MRDALRRGRLAAERAAILAVIPPDPSAELRAVALQQTRPRHQKGALAAGTGRYADGPIGYAVWELRQAETSVARLEQQARRPEASRRDRRRSRAGLVRARERHHLAERELESLTGPEAARLDEQGRRLETRLHGLRSQSIDHRAWVDRHPEAASRIERLTSEIDALDQRLDRSNDVPERAVELGLDGPWTQIPDRTRP